MNSISPAVDLKPLGSQAADTELLRLVLRPYRPHTSYLRSARIAVSTTPADEGGISALCDFEIPESCYIDDTGHFNSVELNICFNQMLYFVLAQAVRHGLLEAFAGWTLEDFWIRQLADILITDFRSSFKRKMNGRRFSAEISIDTVAQWQGNDVRGPLIVVDTTSRFWDDFGGNCIAHVKIAITDPQFSSEGALAS